MVCVDLCDEIVHVAADQSQTPSSKKAKGSKTVSPGVEPTPKARSSSGGKKESKGKGGPSSPGNTNIFVMFVVCVLIRFFFTQIGYRLFFLVFCIISFMQVYFDITFYRFLICSITTPTLFALFLFTFIFTPFIVIS